MGIKGIALLVKDSSGGSQMVFDYPSRTPEAPKPPVQTHRSQQPYHIDNLTTKRENITKLKNSGQNNVFGLAPNLFADMFCPKNKLCNQIFELSVDDLCFISHPTTLNEESAEKSEADNPEKSDVAPNTKYDIISFNVVLVVGTADKDVSMFRHVVSTLCAALHHEQVRCSYLTEHVHDMVHLRDNYTRNDSDDSVNNASNLNALMLKRSSLARELKEVYDGLAMKSAAGGVLINNQVEVVVTLENPYPHPDLPLRPYHTLIFTGDNTREKVLSNLMPDCNPAVIRLVRAMNPIKSFQELQMEVDVPLRQLFRIAAHLIYWKKARVIDTLNQHNIYLVSPSASLEMDSPVAKEFNEEFPSFTLSEVLSRFSAPRRLKDHTKPLVSKQASELIKVVIWLLERDLLRQLHTYVQVVLPDYIPEGENDPELSLYLDQMGDDSQQFVLLKRLMPHFFGNRHIEEIMWRENLARSELLSILQFYKNILVLSLH